MMLIASVALPVLLIGCATSTSPGYSYQTVEPVNVVVDHEKMAVIDHAARKRGVNVHWINRPQRRVAISEADDE
ncbi:MAG: hypothetical protein M0Q42_04305 [Xanthomonadales bacterium]|nr:hypothetical protein [Xanthomonadales bacterium]